MTKRKKKHPTQKTTAERKAKRPIRTVARAEPAPPYSEPPPRPMRRGPASRREMEKVDRALSRILHARADEIVAEGRDPKAEIGEFMQSIASKSFDEIIALAGEPTSEECAQDLADQAMEEDDIDEGRRLAAQALAIDPFCMDALYIEALEDGEPTEALAGRIRGALKKWEDHKGPEYFETHRGHFWGLVETRPYMRVLANLADLLNALDATDEAIAVYERCLELNESDNLGMRDMLLGLYFQTGNMAGARRLFTKFHGDHSAVFAWGKVLYYFRILEFTKAETSLIAAMKANPYFLPVLFEPDLFSREIHGYSPGDVTEAIYCVQHIGYVWIKHKKALEWVIGQLEVLTNSKQAKRRR